MSLETRQARLRAQLEGERPTKTKTVANTRPMSYRGDAYGRYSGPSDVKIVIHYLNFGGVAETGPCALGEVLVHDSHTWLSGGQIYGGYGSFEASEIDLGLTTTLPTSGYCYVKVDATAVTSDGVLLPGCDVTNVTTTIHGVDIPNNKVPTISDPTGYIHVMLGYYTDAGFYPVDCGNILISHCLGGLTFSR